jgi:hypothetical protein
VIQFPVVQLGELLRIQQQFVEALGLSRLRSPVTALMKGDQRQLPASAGHQLKLHHQISARTVAAAVACLDAVLPLTVEQGHLPLQPGGIVLWFPLQAKGGES